METNSAALAEKELKRRIFGIKSLAAMPQVVWQLIQVVNDDRSSVQQVEQIIEADQALASRVLNLANSAFYGFPNQIKTIQRAVVAIGFEELRLMALGAGLAEVFDPGRAPAGWDPKELWRHCLAVSWLSKELALAGRHPDPGEALVAGLLHDVGKLVLALHMRQEFQRLLALTNQGRPYYEAEAEVGLRHTLAGAWLARRWDLPEVFVAVIRDHHLPRPSDPFAKATALVFLANRLVKGLGFGMADHERPVDAAYALAASRLDAATLRGVTERARRQLPKLLDSWERLFQGGGR